MKATLLALVIILFVQASRAQNSEPMLHQYIFNLLNVDFPKADYDSFTKAALEVLRERGRLTTCVDFRRDLIIPKTYKVKNRNGKDQKVTTDVRIFLREELDQDDINAVVDALCKDDGSKCEVVGWKLSQPVSNLNLQFTYRTNSILEPVAKFKSVTRALPELSEFPRFSSSCDSGDSTESVLFSGRTTEAQTLLKLSPVALDKLVRVELYTKQSNAYWNFGRPDIWWTGHPTTKEDQELAPADILKDLH